MPGGDDDFKRIHRRVVPGGFGASPRRVYGHRGGGGGQGGLSRAAEADQGGGDGDYGSGGGVFGRGLRVHAQLHRPPAVRNRTQTGAERPVDETGVGGGILHPHPFAEQVAGQIAGEIVPAETEPAQSAARPIRRIGQFPQRRGDSPGQLVVVQMQPLQVG